MLIYGAALVVMSLAVSGCIGGEWEEEAPHGQLSSAVVGGKASPSIHDSVVLLHVTTDSSEWHDCTGTLISPQIVLTAKHCVAWTHPGSFVCQGNGEIQQDGGRAGLFGDTYPAAWISVYVGSMPSGTPAAVARSVVTADASHACRDDLAVLILDRPLSNVAVAPLRETAETRAGELVDLVGYGMGERTGAIERREVTGVRIAEVGASSSSPDDSGATTPPRAFAVRGNTVCFGDSGGPALSSDSGAVLGVYSRISGDCFAVESRNIYISVKPFLTLIASAMRQVGESSDPEPTPEQLSAPPAAAANPVEAAAPLPPQPAAQDADAATEPSAFRCAATPPGSEGAGHTGWYSAATALVGLALRLRRRRAAYAAAQCRAAQGD